MKETSLRDRSGSRRITTYRILNHKFNNYISLAAVFLILLVSIHCSKEVNTSTIPEYDTSIHLASRLLKIGDTTLVEFETEDGDDSGFVFYWSASIGTIIESEDVVKYIAPDVKGTAVIKVDISDKNNNYLSTDSASIIVYKQIIFLKADDLTYDRSAVVTKRWRDFVDYIKEKKIKANLGIVGTSLEIGTSAYYQYLKDLATDGNFEIWNHGYDHQLNGVHLNGDTYREFSNTSLSQQKAHIKRTQHLAKSKINIVLHTFGAPGNAIDNNTAGALNTVKNIKVWYFGAANSTKMNIKRGGEIEFPAHYPDYTKFLATYNEDKDYIALQIHPNSWDTDKMNEFKNIIEFLIQNDVTFMNPYEYYKLLN